jgi:hypothetical protein
LKKGVKKSDKNAGFLAIGVVAEMHPAQSKNKNYLRVKSGT